MPWPSAATSTAAVLAAGLFALTLGTDGWSIWTAEGARRAAVLERPQALPDYPLRDTHGRSLSLATPERPLTLVDLIYTRCPSVCMGMGARFRQLQGELAIAGLLDRVQLLSITFDAGNDDLAALSGYLKRFGAVEPHWRAARFDDDTQLSKALDELGVIVIPEPNVGFIHNAAFYLIEEGRVVEIFDVDARSALLDALRDRLAL